jgi:hypothetical protein
MNLNLNSVVQTVGHETCQKKQVAVPNTKFLGVQIDKHLNWKGHVQYILPKLSTASFVIRQLFYILNLKTLRMAYFSYFHSIITYFGAMLLIVVRFSD